MFCDLFSNSNGILQRKEKEKRKNTFFLSLSLSFESAFYITALFLDLLECNVCNIVLFLFQLFRCLLTLSFLSSTIIIGKRCHIVSARLSPNVDHLFLEYIENSMHMLLLLLIIVCVKVLFLFFSSNSISTVRISINALIDYEK